jgi:hypothetical protein
MAFEEPERHGYRIFHRTLEEHRAALLHPSWKDVLNYETEWMRREDIVLSSYEASLQLNRIKLGHGLMSSWEVARAEERTSKALKLLELLDRVPAGDAAKLEELRPELERANAIVDRPRNDWELGLRLGRWGILKQGYYLVNQGMAALASLLRAAVRGADRGRDEAATSVSGSNE